MVTVSLFSMQSFWPSGTGTAKGFLGAFDAAWMFKGFCQGGDPLELIRERETLFSRLRSLMRLQPNPLSYTIDPQTRYFTTSSTPAPTHVSELYDTDNITTELTSKEN